MKLEDLIKKTIQEYPGLFKDVDYARSRLKVLSHLFFTIGGGYEIAETKDPAKGGYLVEPNVIEVKGEWVRQPDPPYGEKKYEGPEINQAYFETPIYRSLFDRGLFGGLFDGMLDTTEEIKKIMGELDIQTRMEDCSRVPLSISSVGIYSVVYEMLNKGVTLKPDWVQGAVDISKEALTIFTDPARSFFCTYYPTPASISNAAQLLLVNFKRSEEEYLSLRKLWRYEEGQTVLQRQTQNWVDYLNEALPTLVKFLTQFDVPPPTPEPPDYCTIYDKVREDLLAEETEEDDSEIVQYIIEGKLP